MVSETMRIAGSASCATIAAVSPGVRKSIIAPVTRACMWPVSCSTTVVSQSCACELVAARLLAVEHAGADERPVVVEAGIEQIVEIDRLVRAMEIADAEMQDAGASALARS